MDQNRNLRQCPGRWREGMKPKGKNDQYKYLQSKEYDLQLSASIENIHE